MKKNDVFLKHLLAASISVLLFSCNNEAEKKEDAATTADSAVAKTPTAETPAPAAFTPFDVMQISHTVKDYAKWRPAFDLDSTARKAAGMEDFAVARNADKPNEIMIVLKASNVQKAKDFAADPRLKDVMEKAGVTSKPDIGLLHIIRFNPDGKEKQWVEVSHKVKEFDAWLKVFDGEGTAARAEQGLQDVVLARGIDDPNLVHLVFDIKQTDMAKAKAAIISEEKKKLMLSAGVEGKPIIKFYTAIE
jgi:hypothetical protein